MFFLFVTDIDDCVQHSCRNGQCVDGIDQYTCACAAGWTDNYCDISKYRSRVSLEGAFCGVWFGLNPVLELDVLVRRAEKSNHPHVNITFNGSTWHDMTVYCMYWWKWAKHFIFMFWSIQVYQTTFPKHVLLNLCSLELSFIIFLSLIVYNIYV